MSWLLKKKVVPFECLADIEDVLILSEVTSSLKIYKSKKGIKIKKYI